MPFDPLINIEQLVDRTQDFTGAEIAGLCHNAAFLALQQSLDSESISQAHFDLALSSFKRQVTDDMRKFYNDFSLRSAV